MARWERDPKMRRHVALGIAGAEVVVLTLNFCLIFSAYVYQINLRLGPGEGQLAVERVAALAVVIFATVLALGVGVLVGLVYVRGGGWTRWLFIAANIILICLGAVWFLKNRASGSGPDLSATLAGLMLPVCTLFPILWPLLVFHPGGPKGPAEGP